MTSLCSRHPNRVVMGILVATALSASASIGISAQTGGLQRDISSRADGADRVVVATVARVDPAWVINEYGDRLIVSRLTLVVEESWKGPYTPTAFLEVEGGTIGDLTLRVSDLEPVDRGQRGVFFIRQSSSGINVPHLRGQGVLKLDQQDVITDGGLSLGEVRASIRRRLNGRDPR